MNYLDLGDEIEVLGQRFVLISFKLERDKPAQVEFKQPMELLGEDDD